MDKRVEKTKKAIKSSLMELILQYDYNKITIKMITDKANIGRKTFYLHYGCIEDVMNIFFCISKILIYRCF